tara:strand:- start:7333 stop:8112 length:780 start_codon:yes stop_codon:yes gene_type:complete
MDIYQQNIDDKWKLAGDTIQVVERILPLVFHYDYEKYKNYENSNRVLVPKSLLYKLSQYDNLKYPIHFKLNADFYKEDSDYKDYVYSIYDYVEDIDNIYIPNEYYRDIDLDKLLEYDNQIEIEIINYELPKAESITFKPFTSNFLSIKNPKVYLEAHLKKHYTVLFKNQIISTIYGKTFINIEILDTQPDNIVSILETDVNVEFEAPYDYIDPATIDPSIVPRNKESKELKETKEKNTTDSDSDISVRFPGKGNKLGKN